MREIFYSSGEKKSGGFSGVKIFDSKINNLCIVHGSATTMNAEYEKSLHVSFDMCGDNINLAYVIYSDHINYKTILDWIKNVEKVPDSHDIISRKIIKLCVKFIAENKQFDIISLVNSVFDAGVKVGRIQKAHEFQDLLNER